MKLSKLNLAIIACLSTSTVLAETATLDQVVVTPNNTLQNLNAITANATVITREMIESKQYTTLTEALTQVPGLHGFNSGGLGQASSLFIRGMGGKNILVLQNGIPLNDPTLTDGTTQFANILLNNVERIEIIKGPQSGVWGANASAGVINIITQKRTHGANVNLEVGSHNTKKLNTQLSASNENVNFTIHLSDTSTDGYTAIKKYKTSGDGNETDAFRQQDVSFNLGVQLTTNQRLETWIKTTQATTNFDSGFAADPANDTTQTSLYENEQRALQYLITTGPLQSKLFIEDNHAQRFIANTHYDAIQTRYGLQSDWLYKTNQMASFAITQKRVTGSQPDGWSSFNDVNYTNDAFALNNTNQFLNQKLIFTQALRQDNYNRFEDKTTGKMGVKFIFKPQGFISANYGTGYNAPSVYQLANLYSVSTPLTPESSDGYDLTLGLMGLEVTYFNNQIKNELAYNYNYTTFSGGYYNQAGTSHYQGMEVSYKKSLKAFNSDITLNYAQQTAKDDAGLWLANRPEQQGGISFDFYGFTKTHLGLQTQWVGTLYDKANQKGANIGNYSVTDFVANYQVLKGLSLYGKVQNLLNQDYTPVVATYETDGVTPKYVYNNGGTLWYFGVRGQI